jgi:hypothetical protein
MMLTNETSFDYETSVFAGGGAIARSERRINACL